LNVLLNSIKEDYTVPIFKILGKRKQETFWKYVVVLERLYHCMCIINNESLNGLREYKLSNKLIYW